MQALADFITKFTLPDSNQEAKYWTACLNVSSVIVLRGISVIKTSPENDVLKYGVQLQFLAMNNEVEYEVVLASSKVARALGAKNLRLRSDSKLIVNQRI